MIMPVVDESQIYMFQSGSPILSDTIYLCHTKVWNDIRRWHIAADALERQTGAKVYTNGAESRNVAQNGGYAARYKATAGFQKIPENQVLLNEGKVEQNEGYTDASAEYNGWQE